MENNQSAVEWFTKQLKYAYDSKKAVGSELDMDDINHLSIKAKQMEKEQIKQDYDSGLFDGTMDDVKDRIYKNAEQYYNETYGKK